MINKLQTEFGIPHAVKISEGINGMPRITLTHESGAKAEIYLNGAHITSWTNQDDDELLFLSAKSDFSSGCAIRGGIPVIFPQFGDGPLPKHGFARNQEWTLIGTDLSDDDVVSAELMLIDSPETFEIWPHSFEMVINIELYADSLAAQMRIANTGDKAFDFQAVLHTYFTVADIRQTAVKGLKGVDYLDSLRDRIRETEDRQEIKFAEETDRIYIDAPDNLEIVNESTGRNIYIEKDGMPDVVVWNPWVEKSKRLTDFGDDEYLRMVCVETGRIASPFQLTPGDLWLGETSFIIEEQD